MNIDQLREQLKIDEGVKYEIYNDHLGYATFGIGHLVVEGDEEHGKPIGTPISEERVNSVFDSDVATYVTEAKKVFPNLDTLPEEAQEVIVNMCFFAIYITYILICIFMFMTVSYRNMIGKQNDEVL